ncbi:hypothetical protein J4E06_05360 [Muricauda sp. NFXS6]|uniref:hypothetical protein n=1 Tax=Allomuricauda sp. NFXS6 TaxID=2819094 RepID=UPI0032E020B4
MSTKLNEIQKRRLKSLKPQFENAIRDKDFNNAKIIMRDIQNVLNLNNHKTLLAKYKNWLFELALDLEKYEYAKNGFISNRTITNKNTRIHLESTALLAITYLRLEDIDKAKPYIQEVLQNKNVIKTDRTRKIFNEKIIERFDEEIALSSIREKNKTSYDLDEIENEIAMLVSSKTEDEIFKLIGKSLPSQTKYLLFEVDNFAKNQLSSAERKLLPSSEEIIKDEKAGKTVFKSLKRVLYNSICDSNSQVFKIWNEKITGAVFDTKYLISAITLSLAHINIGIKALIISASALIIRFGLDFYCEHFKPIGIMETRKINKNDTQL